MINIKTKLDEKIQLFTTYPVDNLSMWGFNIKNVNIDNNIISIYYSFHIKGIKLNLYYNDNYGIAYMIKDSEILTDSVNDHLLMIDISKINYFTFKGYVIKINENPSLGTYYNIKNWLNGLYWKKEITMLTSNLFESYEIDDLLKRQTLYNKFNLKFMEYNICMCSFVENNNKYHIKCQLKEDLNLKITENLNSCNNYIVNFMLS